MKPLVIIVSGLIIFALLGCGGNSENSLWAQIKDLENEKSTLKQQAKELQDENVELATQVKTLTDIGPEKRLEVLNSISRIELTKRCGLFDKDKDGKTEKLIIYIKTFDQAGDSIKCSGSVNVKLWNLAADKDNALLTEWDVTPEELLKLWSETFMTSYYRLDLDVENLPDKEQRQLAAIVTFTDYLTGKIFTKQTPIK